MLRLLETSLEPEQHPTPRARGGRKRASSRRPQHHVAGAMALHISKLRGITDPVRSRLKRQGITYIDQLVEAAGGA